ncbi:titin homolog [Leptopilina heterotoma]|uniref:titin homolog n=1 Tax=Leptopilina heterotoma TaxID=63436 RepID=UPI001CA7D214|nr:titin homolog [Leptopilina heterotoma]
MGNAQRKSHYSKPISSSGSGTKKVHWEGPGLPASPGKPILIPGTEETQPDVVSIRWERSTSNGGSAIIGYLVEHRKLGSPNWIRSTPVLCKFSEVTLSGLEPGWRYQFRIRAQNALGLSEPSEISDPLTVTLQRAIASSPYFDIELKDTTSLENEQAEFEVQYSGVPSPKIAWFKDGFEIFSSRRTRIVTENGKSVLLIHRTAIDDEGEIKCTATNRAGHVSTKARLMLEAPPRIRLPRQYEDGLLFEQDETIRLKITLAGRPPPDVTWYHDGDTINKDERHIFESMDGESVLKIPDAKRKDRGEYSVKVTNKLGEDIASFLVTVTDRPSAPGKATVAMTLGRSVTLKWMEPEDDGGCKIGTYIVEYYRVGWDMWLKAATCRQTTTTLSELIEGSEYRFRIKAENPYGVSDPSEESDVVFIPDLKRGITGPLSNKSQSHREIHRGRSERREVSFVEPSQRTRSLTREENYSRGDPVERSLSSQRLSSGRSSRSDSRVTFALDVVDHSEEMQKKNDQVKVSDVHEKRKEPTATTIIVTPTFDDSGGESPVPQPRSRSIGGTTKTPAPPKPPRAHDPRSQVPTSPDRTHLSPPRTPVSTLRKEQHFTDLSAQGDSAFLDVKRKQFARTEPASFADDDENALHGSSEFVLVLYPDDRDSQQELDRHSQTEIDFSGRPRSRTMGNEEDDLVPPPKSISLPELFRIDHQFVETMREAVSSTELLHERAMERFYRAVAVDEAKRQIPQEIDNSDLKTDPTNDTLEKYPLFEQRISLRKKVPAHSSLWQTKRDRRRCSDSQTDTLRVPTKLIPGVLEDVASDPNLSSLEPKMDHWGSQQLDSENSPIDEMNRFSGKVRTQYSGQDDYPEEVGIGEYSEEVDRVDSEPIDPEVDQTEYFDEIDQKEYSEVTEVDNSEPLRRWHDYSSENTFTPIMIEEPQEKKIETTWQQKQYEEVTETMSVETSIESSEEESSDEDLRLFRARILAIPVENEEDTYHPRGNPVRHVSPEKTAQPPIPSHRVQVIEPTPESIRQSIPSPPMSPVTIVPKSILKKRVEPDSVPVNQFGRPVPPEKPIETDVKKLPDEPRTKNTSDFTGTSAPEMVSGEMSLSAIDNENVLSAAEVAQNRRRQLKQMSKSSITSSDNEEERFEQRMAVVSHYTEIVNQFSQTHKPFPPQKRVPTPTFSRTEKINPEEIVKSLSIPPTRVDYSSDERSSDSQNYRDRNLNQEFNQRSGTFSPTRTETRRARSRADEIPAPRSRNVSTDRAASSRSSSKTRRGENSKPRSRNVSSERGGGSSRSSSKTRNDQSSHQNQSSKYQSSSRTSSRSNSRDRSRAQTPTEAKMERLQSQSGGRRQRSRRISTHERYDFIDPHTKYLLEIQAERNVRSNFSFVTDVILLLAAVYVYIFKEAIFAIPIIGLILYRRIQQGICDLIPKWLRGPRR